MSQARHIIKNAMVDFQYAGTMDGLALQNEVKDWVQELVERLETEFDAMVPIDSFLAIDSLELEVVVSGGNWREEASKQLLRQLRERLSIFESMDAVERKNIPNGKDRIGELFLFYLQQGHLPWQASSSDKQRWPYLLEAWLKEPMEAWVVKLSEVLSSSGLARDRFIRMVPFQLALTLFSTFAESRERGLIEDYRLLFSLAQKNERSALQHIYLSFLLDVFIQQEASYLPVLLKKEKSLAVSFKKSTFQSAYFKQVKNEQQQHQQYEQETEAMELAAKVMKEIAQKAKAPNTDQGEGIYISNSGLVIVASFLPVFFEKFGIRPNEGGQSAEDAVCLVNYLATGKEKMQEFELVLPKLLCGLPLDTVIDPSLFVLAKEVKQEVESLLSSVIAHWSILKNTSVEGLRESFLLREGKLIHKGNNWTLQVEQKSYDMLLQELPWAIGMIKLPWMSGLLTTEWVY